MIGQILVHAAVVSVLALLAIPSARPAFGQQAAVIADGKADYEQNCVGCHGSEAKGDGRMAEILTIKPPNLTRIAERNHGVFPFWKVYATIDGEEAVKGHMFTPMPLWWDRFKQDEKKPGYLPAHVRILEITHYLESIQLK